MSSKVKELLKEIKKQIGLKIDKDIDKCEVVVEEDAGKEV